MIIQRHRIRAVPAVLTAFVLGGCIAPLSSAYGQPNAASVEVNGKSAIGPIKKLNTTNATGSNAAAANVFLNGKSVQPVAYLVNGDDASSSVNGKGANQKSEVAVLSGLAQQAANSRNMVNENILVRNPALQSFQQTIISSTAENAGSKGNFPLVAKASIGKSDTGELAPTVKGQTVGTAKAMANQSVTNNGTQVQFGDSVTSSGMINGGVGVAFTAHHDPISVDWTSASNRSLTLDLSQVSFTVQTVGSNATAVGVLGITGSYIDNTSSLNLPESSATPLFSLTLPVISVDGGPPEVYTGALSLSASGTVTDSLGDSGLSAVTQGLISQLTVTSTETVDFSSPYTITFGLPGSASTSVLYLDETTFALASAVPEPSSEVLLLTGIVGLACLWKRRRK
jgi:hypothetical protein